MLGQRHLQARTCAPPAPPCITAVDSKLPPGLPPSDALGLAPVPSPHSYPLTRVLSL